MEDGVRRAVGALSSVQGVGPVTIAALERVHGSVEVLLDVPVKQWVGTVSLTAQARESLAKVERLAAVADWLTRRLRVLGQRIVFRGDPAWPPNLGAWAPRVLFMVGPGAAAPPRRRVAIVGTRHPESGAAERVRGLARELAQQGVGVVSGAAEGIDQAGHFGALDRAGETWAFLGCAIDQLDAPQRHLVRPFRDGGGTFFSQFPPGARADRSTFTRRNPLIAGASDVVLVARAPKRSGALQTAVAARALKRPLLAIPGDPWNRAAEGTNRLLQEGARVCLSSNDVVEALGLTGAVARVIVQPGPQSELSAAARTVLAVLSRHASDVDELCVKTGLPAGDISAALSELEIEGCAVQKGGGQWEHM
jgi:DNA processing protein